MSDDYDVVVIGGGAAGLSAALTLCRSLRSVLVVDAGEPRNAPAAGVHGLLTRDGISPHDLGRIGRAEVASYGGQVRDGRVVSASREGSGFVVRLEDGHRATGRRLLVATGLTDRLPDVPGLAEGWGRDVVHCPYCHGYEVRDRVLGVLATSPMAVHQAKLFRQLTADLTILDGNGPGLAPGDRQILEARGVRVVREPVTAFERDGDRLVGARLAGGELVPLEVVTVQTHVVANAEVLAPLGIRPVPMAVNGQVLGEYVTSDPLTFRAAPGVWVAGNVNDLMGQVVHAAGAGVRAGAMVNADLIEEEFAQAAAGGVS